MWIKTYFCDLKQLPNLWLACNSYCVLSYSFVSHRRMQTQFHWQLLWKWQPSVVPPKEENRQENAFYCFISAWVNCMPMISAFTMPVEMHKKNTVLGKMYICGPSPQAALTNQVRFYAFQKFSYLNKAIMFWVLPLTIAAQVSTHMIAESREGWGKLSI